MYFLLLGSCVLFESSDIDLSSTPSDSSDTSETVNPEPPSIELLLPEFDFTEENTAILFKARISDPNYDLEELTLSFSSDLDDEFCTPILENSEEAYCEAILSLGEHSLTFTASNPDSLDHAVNLEFSVLPSSQIDNDGDGFSEDDGDCNDEDALISPNGTEIINDIDDDCNDLVDDGTDSYDDDGDGYSENDGDCDDQNSEAHPTSIEICDAVDQDCNGLIDDGTSCYDDDGDGFSEDDGDCDDANFDAFPNNPESADGVDNNCDGHIDEGTEFFDDDGDCFCESSPCYGSFNASCSTLEAGDCDDGDINFSPDAVEYCDSLDTNCNNQPDDYALDASIYYLDSDWDGHGDPSNSISSCSRVLGYVTNANDCNDSEPLAWTGAGEYCDGVDNDCNGQTDEVNALDCDYYYVDGDLDGYGDVTAFQCQCAADSYFSANNDDDCFDSNPLAYPGASYQTIDRGDGSFDYNCDGIQEPQYLFVSNCSIQNCQDGWANTIPSCGFSNLYEEDCFFNLWLCNFNTSVYTQACR